MASGRMNYFWTTVCGVVAALTAFSIGLSIDLGDDRSTRQTDAGLHERISRLEEANADLMTKQDELLLDLSECEDSLAASQGVLGRRDPEVDERNGKGGPSHDDSQRDARVITFADATEGPASEIFGVNVMIKATEYGVGLTPASGTGTCTLKDLRLTVPGELMLSVASGNFWRNGQEIQLYDGKRRILSIAFDWNEISFAGHAEHYQTAGWNISRPNEIRMRFAEGKASLWFNDKLFGVGGATVQGVDEIRCVGLVSTRDYVYEVRSYALD